MKKLLITFGCSWTYGIGLNYQPGMNFEQYEKVSRDQTVADNFSFRGLLAKKHNYTNKNFSYGGASNQGQFRRAAQYFSSLEFLNDKQEFDHIIVLWGITSIYRDEIYLNTHGRLNDYFYGHKNIERKYIEQRFKKTFDEHNEIRKLSLDILLWDSFFKAHGITNYWYDTFNHLDYTVPLEQYDIELYKTSYKNCAGEEWPSWDDYWNDNLNNVNPEVLSEISDSTRFDWAKHKNNFAGFKNFLAYSNRPRDLASFLALHNGSQTVDTATHKSDWNVDTDRIGYLEQIGLINPISLHPTKTAHQQIADYLDTLIDFV